jgi:hypothetical protein
MEVISPPTERPELVLEPGKGIPGGVLQELVRLRSRSKDASEDFNTAVKAQSIKYQVEKAALRLYVRAVQAGKVARLQKSADALQLLLELNKA